MPLNTKYIALGGSGILTVAGVAIGMNYLPKGKPMKQELLDQGKTLINLGGDIKKYLMYSKMMAN